MQISDWLTIISIMLASFAFFSNTERKILFIKTKVFFRVTTLIILFLLIPILIYYDKLAVAFPFLYREPFLFNSKFLPNSNDWAFILFFILIGFWIWGFLYRLEKVRPTKKLIDHYLQSSKLIPFDELFRLFIKYESKQLRNPNNSSIYTPLLTNELFFHAALDYSPNTYVGFVEGIDSVEIINSKLPVLIRDKVNALARKNKRLGVVSEYNYEPVNHSGWPKEELLLFYLTDTYDLIFRKCISDNHFSSDTFNMLNYYPHTMFVEVLRSISVPEDVSIKSDSPTYNHKLLGNFLSFFDGWVTDANESGNGGIIVSHSVVLHTKCIIELLVYNESVISLEFLNSQFCSFLRNTYFNDRISNIESIRAAISKIFINEIPNENLMKKYYQQRFSNVWEYSDDDIFNGERGVFKHEKSKRNKFKAEIVEKITVF
jgi:hypothetical protein